MLTNRIPVILNNQYTTREGSFYNFYPCKRFSGAIAQPWAAVTNRRLEFYGWYYAKGMRPI